MKNEFNILPRLDHKYIVGFEEMYENKDNFYLVIQECKGGELFDRIKAKRRYPENDAKPVIKMLCEALLCMHQEHEAVHCDLAPDNIVFLTEDDKSIIKLIDFGATRICPKSQKLKELCGTPYYTAPEIINDAYDQAADMWSVGVITYVMLFGFPPFYVDPNQYIGSEETKAIYEMILKGFQPEIKVKFHYDISGFHEYGFNSDCIVWNREDMDHGFRER